MDNKDRVHIIREMYEEAAVILGDIRDLLVNGEFEGDQEIVDYFVNQIEQHDAKASEVLKPEVMQPEEE